MIFTEVKLYEKALCKSKRAHNRNSQRLKKKMLLLTRKVKKPYNNQKICWVAKKNLVKHLMKTTATAKYPYSKI